MNPDYDTGPDPDATKAMAYIRARLADPRVEAFFTSNRHKQSATRGILELFGVHPLPDWCQRRPSGQAARHKAALDRFNADHPGRR